MNVLHLDSEESDFNVILTIKLCPGKTYQYLTSKFIEGRFLYLCKLTKNSMKAFNYLKKNSKLIRRDINISHKKLKREEYN